MGPPLWKLHVHFHWFSGMQCSETLCFFWRLTLYAQDSGAAAQDSGGAAQDSGGVAPDCRRKRNRQLVDFGNFGQLWQRSNLQHLDLSFYKSTRTLSICFGDRFYNIVLDGCNKADIHKRPN